MLELRPYQREACDAFYDYLGNAGLAACVELATGTGKSLVAATICKELIERHPSARIVIVTHSRELVQQDALELLSLWPQAPIGINSAGLGRRDWRSQILICSIQSVHRHAALIGPVDLMIVDECQLISRKASTMYQKLINELRDVTPDMRLLGLSATLFRLDSGGLDEGEGALFDKIVYKYGIAKGIADGYLAPLISKAMLAEIDTSNVKLAGGEFVQSQLEAAALAGNNVEKAADEMLRYGRERHSWLAFCSGVQHANAVAQALRDRDIAAETVFGDTPKAVRDARIAASKRGDVRCLVSVGVLGIGFNNPKVDMIALLRPTKSPGLAIQQIGRGTRLADSKENCLILDFAQILKTHGPVDQMAPPDRKRRKAKLKPDILVKICPECNGIMAPAARVCDQCGAVFPRSERDGVPNDGEADATSVVLSAQEKPRWMKVRGWSFKTHKKINDRIKEYNAKECLQISYRIGLNLTVNEFLHFDRTGNTLRKAYRRWNELLKSDKEQSKLKEDKYGNIISIVFGPRNTSEAFEFAESCLQMPTQIMIRKSGEYFEVINSSYEEHDLHVEHVNKNTRLLELLYKHFENETFKASTISELVTSHHDVKEAIRSLSKAENFTSSSSIGWVFRLMANQKWSGYTIIEKTKNQGSGNSCEWFVAKDIANAA